MAVDDKTKKIKTTMSKTSSYKGHPTISLDAESKYPFTFGLSKAKLVLKHLDEIRAFVAQHEAQAGGMDAANERAGEDATAGRIGA